MILDSKDARRVYRLTDDLLTYATDVYGLTSLFGDRWDEDAHDNFMAIAYRLFNGDSLNEVIDAYVEDRRGVVPRTDLRQVERWKLALAGEFGCLRVGPDVYFTFDEYVFCVRGIMQEIDTMVHDQPALVSMVILPFESVLTYCLGALDHGKDPESDEMVAVEEQVKRAIGARAVIRSAAKFCQVSPKIHAAHASDVNKDGMAGTTGTRPFIIRL